MLRKCPFKPEETNRLMICSGSARILPSKITRCYLHAWCGIGKPSCSPALSVAPAERAENPDRLQALASSYPLYCIQKTSIQSVKSVIYYSVFFRLSNHSAAFPVSPRVNKERACTSWSAVRNNIRHQAGVCCCQRCCWSCRLSLSNQASTSCPERNRCQRGRQCWV